MTTHNPNEPDERGDASGESADAFDAPIVNDKRRIDPVTGAVRGSQDASDAADGAAGADGHTVSDEELERLIADAQAAESEEAANSGAPDSDDPVDAHLEDLKRVTAEYANYRRRTEQEKLAARDVNTAEVLKALLPVLDDLDRAEEHGDLPEDAAVTVIANKLRGTLEKLGLEAYGEKGEPFDPTIHEAIAQLPSADATGETIADVVQRGYRVGERTVRVAKVAVFVPASA